MADRSLSYQLPLGCPQSELPGWKMPTRPRPWCKSPAFFPVSSWHLFFSLLTPVLTRGRTLFVSNGQVFQSGPDSVPV